MILAAFLLAAAAADVPVVYAVEPRPARQALKFEAQCGARALTLDGLGLGAPSVDLRLDGKPTDLPAGAKAFLSEGRAAYRVSAVCPASAPTFQLRLYRVSGSASGGLAYANYALDVTADGKIQDRGGSAIDADAFWYR